MQVFRPLCSIVYQFRKSSADWDKILKIKHTFAYQLCCNAVSYMNKNTKSKRATLKTTKASLFLLVFLCCSTLTFGQFKINHNTKFTAKNVVSSKEEANVFESSILGDNELVLNGEHQHLETAANTSLPTLRVANGNELTIRTEVTLRKNLVVQSGVLKLEKPLHVKGKVILDNNALLYNDHFVNYENAFVFHKNYTNTTNIEITTSAAAWVAVFETETIIPLCRVKEKSTSINESNISQFKANPFLPPPEATTGA